MNPKLIQRSLLHSLGVVAYVALVASVMSIGEKNFDEVNPVLAGTAFLLLFSVSAAVVGSFVFGYPVTLFLRGQRREGIVMAAATIGWMVVEVAIIFGILFATR